MRTQATVQSRILHLFRERTKNQRHIRTLQAEIAEMESEIAQLDIVLISLPEGATPETQI